MGTIVSANDAENTTFRSAMKAGVKETRNLTAEESLKELEAAAASVAPPDFLNKEAPKGAYVWKGPA